MTEPNDPRAALPVHEALYFVGALPPAALNIQVMAWQRNLEHVITAPHVTLKAPGPLSSVQLRACQEVCRHTSPFEALLGGVRTFPDRVIYLNASGPGLWGLHTRLVAATGGPAGEFELAGYHPHLTLALSWRPLRFGPMRDWSGVLAAAQAEFAALEHAPVSFTVRETVLFRKDRPGEPYSEVDRWSLNG